MLRLAVALAAVIAVGVLLISAHRFVTPIAILWYQPGFEDAVADALTKIPDYEGACIFDDSQHRFVGSIDQLDSRRMIEIAVLDRLPVPRTLWREPHFRVDNGQNTYYWSFKEQRFYPFVGSTWALRKSTRSLCAAYRSNPAVFSRERLAKGMPVTEQNFCCIPSLDSPR